MFVCDDGAAYGDSVPFYYEERLIIIEFSVAGIDVSAHT